MKKCVYLVVAILVVMMLTGCITKKPATLSKILLKGPADGELFVDTENASLTWKTDGKDVSYEIYLGKNNLSTVPVKITKETSYVPTLEGNKTYLWKIVAKEGDKVVTSETRKFITKGTIANNILDLSSLAYDNLGSGYPRMPWKVGKKLYFVFNYEICESNLNETTGKYEVPTKVLGAVNTIAHEISPCVLNKDDGSVVMYYASDIDAKNYDIYRAVLNKENNSWENVEKVSAFSGEGKEWSVWVNKDETIAYFTSSSSFSGHSVSNTDVYKSTKVGNIWATPESVDALNDFGMTMSNVSYDEINNRVWVDDGKDIYVCFEKDEVMQKVKLGSNVNTSGNDREIMIDGNTMYYISLRTVTIGGVETTGKYAICTSVFGE